MSEFSWNKCPISKLLENNTGLEPAINEHCHWMDTVLSATKAVGGLQKIKGINKYMAKGEHIHTLVSLLQLNTDWSADHASQAFKSAVVEFSYACSKHVLTEATSMDPETIHDYYVCVKQDYLVSCHLHIH